ncbi:hypothetical protein niasHS_010031 [Heterodera schachtii]|uniref:Regulatory protein zeste n=1 Tax=Heterodera schachtii TaxID=97005 RepID=A0ABD2J320_HETSC
MSSRGTNLGADEMLAFAKAVEKRHETLFNTASGPAFRKMIDSSWIEVAEECAELGHLRFKDKTVKQLRGDIWQKKKEAALKKYDFSQKTGTGATKFEEWELVILRICKTTKQADGLPVADTGEEPTELQKKAFGGDEETNLEIEVLSGTQRQQHQQATPSANTKSARIRPAAFPVSRSETPYSVRSASSVGGKRKFDESDLEQQQQEKMRLQIETMKTDIEMKKLLIYEKKTALGLPATIDCEGIVVANEPLQRRKMMHSQLFGVGTSTACGTTQSCLDSESGTFDAPYLAPFD